VKLKSFEPNVEAEKFRFLGTHADGADEGIGLEFYFENENSKISPPTNFTILQFIYSL